MINLHQLRVFASVVEHGSFTQAAQHLYLTQPSVTAQVGHLRAFLGTELLAREGRHVVPTAAGVALYRFACEFLAAADALRDQVRVITSGESDAVSVGGNSAYSVYVLPQLLAPFHRSHPNVRISVVSAPGQELIERARTDRLDLAVLLAHRAPAELVISTLGMEELVIVESAERPISSDGQLTLEEVAGMAFVVPRLGTEPALSAVDRALEERGLPARRVAMELTTWEGIREAVRAGVGLALAPYAAVQPGIGRGELRRVAVEGFQDLRTVFLVQSRRRQAEEQPAAYRELLQLLTTELPGALNLQPSLPD